MALRYLLIKVAYKVLYFSFLALGIYWVYVVDAVDKYLAEKQALQNQKKKLANCQQS